MARPDIPSLVAGVAIGQGLPRMEGSDGGSAHCAGLESRHPQRQACVNIDERTAWIWYTLRGASPRFWCAPRVTPRTAC